MLGEEDGKARKRVGHCSRACTHKHTHTHTHTPPCIRTDTPASVVEEAFNRLVERDDIGIVLINQHVRPSGEEGCEEGACTNLFPQGPCLGREIAVGFGSRSSAI